MGEQDRAERMRAFLAVAIGEEVRDRVLARKREWEHAIRAVRWVRDEGLHATVKFLGAVRQETMKKIESELREELRGQAPFTAQAQGIGAFPSARWPQTIWIGLHARELAELAARVERRLAPLGFPPEPRPFHGHVTLGRVKRGAPPHGLVAALAAHAEDRFGESRVTELLAFRSHLREGGSVYTKLWSIPFGRS